MIDSVIKANKKYYPQLLLEERKYIQKKIKTEDYIDEDLERSESDSDSNNETKSDIDKKYFNTNKSLVVSVNHSLLGFFLCQFVRIYEFNSILLNK